MQPRQHQAGDHFQRLADHLAHQRVQAAGHLVHVVREAAHQVGRAVVAEGGQIHPQRAAIEELAQVERRQLRHPRDEDAVGDQEEILQQRARQEHEDHQHEGFEGILRANSYRCTA